MTYSFRRSWRGRRLSVTDEDLTKKETLRKAIALGESVQKQLFIVYLGEVFTCV